MTKHTLLHPRKSHTVTLGGTWPLGPHPLLAKSAGSRWRPCDGQRAGWAQSSPAVRASTGLHSWTWPWTCTERHTHYEERIMCAQWTNRALLPPPTLLRLGSGLGDTLRPPPARSQSLPNLTGFAAMMGKGAVHPAPGTPHFSLILPIARTTQGGAGWTNISGFFLPPVYINTATQGHAGPETNRKHREIPGDIIIHTAAQGHTDTHTQMKCTEGQEQRHAHQ